MPHDRDSDDQRGQRIRRVLLLLTLCALIITALGYNYYQHWSKPAPSSKGRPLQSFITTWHCEKCGHELDDRGSTGTRPCPKCGGNMYVQIRYACSKHGTFPVLFQYDAASKSTDPAKIRVADGEWVPYADEDYNINIRCPRCGVEMMPAEKSRSAP